MPTPAAVQHTLDVILERALKDPHYDVRGVPLFGAFNAAAVRVGHEAFTYLEANHPGWRDYEIGSLNWLWFFGTRGEQLEVIERAVNDHRARMTATEVTE